MSRSEVLTQAVAEIAKRLDVKAAELAQIIGVSYDAQSSPVLLFACPIKA